MPRSTEQRTVSRLVSAQFTYHRVENGLLCYSITRHSVFVHQWHGETWTSGLQGYVLRWRVFFNNRVCNYHRRAVGSSMASYCRIGPRLHIPFTQLNKSESGALSIGPVLTTINDHDDGM
ncbi:hypothetical protein BX600DRAFT_450409 [Xylariales sp. PMI_506]|nr:hypothetical protein BX600DRAFT_450409 [Xylariales sp. PMI_506]